jgi:ParB family chromosome partitioning protein
MAAGCRTRPCSTGWSREAEAEAEAIAAEGWKWIEVAVELPLRPRHGLRELTAPGRSDAEEQRDPRGAARRIRPARSGILRADELPDEIDSVSARSRQALPPSSSARFDLRAGRHRRAGVFVSIDADGSLSVDRGYVRPEDEPPVPSRQTARRRRPDATRRPPPDRAARRHHHRRPARRRPEDDDEDDASSRCPNGSSSS